MYRATDGKLEREVAIEVLPAPIVVVLDWAALLVGETL